MENVKTKPWYTSKEIWFGAVVVLNVVLNQFGLPSFEPGPEFMGAVSVIFMALRTWFTDAKLTLSKRG